MINIPNQEIPVRHIESQLFGNYNKSKGYGVIKAIAENGDEVDVAGIWVVDLNKDSDLLALDLGETIHKLRKWHTKDGKLYLGKVIDLPHTSTYFPNTCGNLRNRSKYEKQLESLRVVNRVRFKTNKSFKEFITKGKNK